VKLIIPLEEQSVDFYFNPCYNDMMKPQVYIESCIETLNRDIKYDYVLCSPPDFDELGEEKDLNYSNFVDTWAPLLNPIGNFVSICISDRKYNGEILSKHSQVIDSFKKLDYKLHTHKLWIKGLGANMFRMNYQHLLTFSRNGQKRKVNKELLPDCFVNKHTNYEKYTYGMPTKIVELLIDTYTDEGNTVYDPFMGSGTTAEASLNTNRKWIGSEINPDYADLCLKRTALL
jgi:DNA modification methylase|tara:strand:+ start:4238 stop:4930 length:693 start_codon:yes stop_codon:yes gene_type:complete